MFYKLEVGNIIDENVTRNPHATNAILVFAVLDAFKILLVSKLISPDAVYDDNFNIGVFILTFLLEDGPELILEYFYIDKYISTRPPWYLLVKDAFAAGIMLYPTYCAFKFLIAEYRKKKTKDFMNKFFFVLLATALLLMPWILSPRWS